MFLFTYQLKLSASEYNDIRDICIFDTVIHISNNGLNALLHNKPQKRSNHTKKIAE